MQAITVTRVRKDNAVYAPLCIDNLGEKILLISSLEIFKEDIPSTQSDPMTVFSHWSYNFKLT